MNSEQVNIKGSRDLIQSIIDVREYLREKYGRAWLYVFVQMLVYCAERMEQGTLSFNMGFADNGKEDYYGDDVTY